MNEPNRVTLPAVLMRAIALICTDPDTTPADAYTAAVLITHGYALWDRVEQFDPTSVQIPYAQWRQVCQLLIDLAGSDITRANYGLSWMNQGPSAYEPVD